MKTIIQLSDLHFGRHETDVAEKLVITLKALSPDVVVITGDLTQRAKISEFSEVSKFLNSLPNVKVVVPGNHDIPLYNIWMRFLRPLVRYRHFINKDVEPVYMDDEVCVVGLNSARSFTFKSGDISSEQLMRVRDALANVQDGKIKFVAMHHPLETLSASVQVSLKKLGVHAVMYGHTHVSDFRQIRLDDDNTSGDLLLIQAGTATSNRYRNQNNSFNVIKVDGSDIVVELQRWNKESRLFELIETVNFNLKHLNQ